MSSEFEVSDDVKELIAEIAAKYNWGPISVVKYYPGTELGDGYASKHVAVDIVRESDTLKLFVKYSLNFKSVGDLQVVKLYEKEAYFYNEVYPAYNKFLREKGFYKGFDNVPKCFGTSIKNVIALENLKANGFDLFDRKKMMNDRHIFLVLEAFANFHATSFALKDQRPSEYDKLQKYLQENIWGATADDNPMVKVFRDMIQAALNSLDPEKDKGILERCDVDALTKDVLNITREADDYSVITKGDCWCNNIMFSYENDDKENPVGVMHVDWQLVQPASLVYDISYFLLTVASPEVLSKLDSYLHFYYSHLFVRIRKLGSDPRVLYPRPVFEKEWKQYCRYGLAMAFMVLKVMLINKDEVPKFDEADFENPGDLEIFSKFQNEEEYTRRLRILIEFCISKDYI